MSSHALPLLQVAAKAAIVNQDGKVLVLREAPTGPNNTKDGLWSLPGGRLDPGESFEHGLAREVLEETGLAVEVIRPLYVGEWHPVIRGVEHQIIAIFMLCSATSTQVTLSEEHDAYQWIVPAKRADVDLMDPDDLVIDAIPKQ